MAIYSGNEDYLVIDGIDVSHLRRQIDFTPNQENADVSHGSGIEWREKAEGLKTVDMTMWIGYLEEEIDTILAVTKTGLHTVEYGPKGNTIGNPRHKQLMMFTSAPTSSNHEKTEGRGFNVAATSAAAPEFDMFNGDTF